MTTSSRRSPSTNRAAGSNVPASRQSQSALNPTDPRVRLMALVLATRDAEVHNGSIPSESAHQVPPTIARAIASLLLEIGKDAMLTSDLITSIGVELGDPAFAKKYANYVSGLSERLRAEMPIDPLEGHTIAVQRRAQKIVGDEAAAVRRKSSSDILASPLRPKSPPEPMPITAPEKKPTAGTRRTVPTTATAKPTSKRTVRPKPPTVRVTAPVVKPKALSEITDQLLAATFRRLAAKDGAAFDQIAALEIALEGYQAAAAADKHRSSAQRDAASMREFEARCGGIFAIMREEAVRLGAADASFTVDDLHRMLKAFVQKLGLVIEMGGGHVRLKGNGKKKPGH